MVKKRRTVKTNNGKRARANSVKIIKQEECNLKVEEGIQKAQKEEKKCKREN